MIIEFLSNVKDPQGMDVGAICSYIEVSFIHHSFY